MSSFVDVAKLDDVAPGTMRKVSVGGREVLLARVGNTFYAAQNRCPHMGGDLSAGKLEGTVVTCPRHGSRFDLVDGCVVRWTNWSGAKLALAKLFRSPRPIVTYQVKLENGRVMVETV